MIYQTCHILQVEKLNYAGVCIGTRDLNQALAYFYKAVESGDMWVTFLAVDQRFNYLHSNPEFMEIVRSTGLDLNK